MVANELFISAFNLSTGQIAFDAAIIFKVGSVVRFTNSFAAGLPMGGVSVIVLRDNDEGGVASNGRAQGSLSSLTRRRASNGWFIPRA